MYSHFSIIFAWIAYGICYSNYNIFEGFDLDQSKVEADVDTDAAQIQTTVSDRTTTVTDRTNVTIPNTLPANKKITPNVTCPEEMPTNLGSYEIPTNKDIVIFTKDLLLSMFKDYERNAMTLLVDIKERRFFKGCSFDEGSKKELKEKKFLTVMKRSHFHHTYKLVSKAAANLESKCPYNKQSYKRCVKRVSTQGEGVIKDLVNSLQMEKIDVTALTDDTICSLSDMKSDPMPLIKQLALETVMLKFALPGFLRLLHTCSELCLESQDVAYAKKPLRRVTDQELVVKHFLTNKNYIELIKDSRRSV